MNTLVSMCQNQGDREYQQDAMSAKSFRQAGTLCILADGMGGYEGGEIASKLIIDTFMKMTIDGASTRDILEKNLHLSNKAIAEYKRSHEEVKSMGSTAIAFFITSRSFQWISVGDSPLYVVRNNKIERINQNHSISGLLDLQLKKGEITQKEVDENPNKHMLTSAMTGEDLPDIDISKEYGLKENFLFILASDGIETLSEKEINSIIQKNVTQCTQAELDTASKALVDAVLAKKKPHQDNVTVILVSQDIEPSQDMDSITNITPKIQGTPSNTLPRALLSGKTPYVLLAILLVLVFVGLLLFTDPESSDINEGNTTDQTTLISKETNKTSPKIKDTNTTVKKIDTSKKPILPELLKPEKDKVKKVKEIKKIDIKITDDPNNITAF